MRELFTFVARVRYSSIRQSSSSMMPNRDRTVDQVSRSFRVLGEENWRALLRTGANMLIVGPRPALEAFVAAAANDLSDPVWLIGPTQEIPLENEGTFVLYDASRLDQAQQLALLARVSTENQTRLRIISLSERHLWDADGATLLLDLYYRLNTICLEIEPDLTDDVPVRATFDRALRTIRAAG
jgi:hypothetical protein